MSRLALEPGTMADYAALAEHHYLSARPATATRVLCFRRSGPTVIERYTVREARPQVVAVLVESLPSLSCAMRDLATSGRYTHGSPRARAMLLNAEVRTISRVIVHPQWRGIGLAVALVRQALDTATTPYVEALAAMGEVHPFFAIAGMTGYVRPAHAADDRLLAALDRVGLSATDLASASAASQKLAALEADQQAFAQRELSRWHRQALRASPGASPEAILLAARQRLGFRPVYFLHRKKQGGNAAPCTPSMEGKR